MHLSELIIKAGYAISRAEDYYATGDKGMAANIIAELGASISGSITAGKNFCSYTEPAPDESLENEPEDQPSEKPGETTGVVAETEQETQ